MAKTYSFLDRKNIGIEYVLVDEDTKNIFDQDYLYR